MHRIARHVLIALTVAVLSACGGSDSVSPAPTPVTPVQGDAFAAMHALGRSVNLGNILEAPNEGAWGLRLTEDLFDAAHSAGATAIRLPIRWSNHALAIRPYTIDPNFFSRVDYAINAASSRGMRVVIDMHHHRQLDGDQLDVGEFAVEDNVLNERFVEIWRQIAQHYKGRSDELLFEPYNEPHGFLTAARWNSLFAAALAAVRSVDTLRYVVVGPVGWNSANELANLALPASDRRLIVTVHSYEPFNFTHQGADWVGLQNSPVVTCCSASQLASIAAPLDVAKKWGDAQNRPILVGEWGSYDHAPYDSRVVYTRAMRNALDARALGWMYWEFAAGFGIYDHSTGLFRTELRDALFR